MQRNYKSNFIFFKNVRLLIIAMLTVHKTTVKPKFLIMAPIIKGRIAVTILSAPTIPTYNALFSLLLISIKTPSKDICLALSVNPEIRNTIEYKIGEVWLKNNAINGSIPPRIAQ